MAATQRRQRCKRRERTGSPAPRPQIRNLETIGCESFSYIVAAPDFATGVTGLVQKRSDSNLELEPRTRSHHDLSVNGRITELPIC